MKSKITTEAKIGFMLAVTFAVVTLIVDINAFNCSGMFCGIAAAFPAMPWFFLGGFLGQGEGLLFIFQAINMVIIYFIGYGIGKLFIRSKK